jgi:hypothetical protein
LEQIAFAAAETATFPFRGTQDDADESRRGSYIPGTRALEI